MATVGIRELKNQTSELIRRVEAGEAIAVTNHGRIVARIVPPAVTQEEIEQSLALLDHINEVAQALPWPQGITADEVLSDIRREV